MAAAAVASTASTAPRSTSDAARCGGGEVVARAGPTSGSPDRGRRDRGGRRASAGSCFSPSASSSDDENNEDDVAEFGGRGVAAVRAPTAVAVKRLKDLQEHLVDLEDLELLDRHLDGLGAADNDCALAAASPAQENAAEELRQKNKDLVLAARLGKALLAKNDELSLMNERLAEEYGDRLEEIEQDRHRLRRQLAQARAECEQRCHELQADLRDLQAVLDSRERQLREADKQKRAVVRELTDQNGRLQSHIRELSQAETELRHKCRLLEDSQQSQLGSGKWSAVGGTAGSPASITNGGSTTDYGSLTPDDYRSLDVLRDEIDMKAAEKQRLQKRMAELRADRDRLAELLELKDRQLAECRAEATHYEHRSAMLAKQLDDALCSGSAGDWKGRKCASCKAPVGCTNAAAATASYRASDGTEPQPMSLLAELELAEARATGGAQSTTAVAPPQMVDVDLTRATEQQTADRLTDFAAGQSDVERLAARLCDALERQSRRSSDGRSAELSADTRYRLLKAISSGVADDGIANGRPADLAELVRNRDGRVAELTCELAVRDAELQAAREERDVAVRDKMDAMRIKCAGEDRATSGADEKNSSLIPELLRKAWEQRDGAVRRKNAVQVQLARTRVDVLQANGQLMEAIGQKVELSQQLEQWQMDMQCLLDEQMRRKLLAPQPQSSASGTAEYGSQQKCGGGASTTGGGFPSMTASSLGSLGSSSLMNSLLMIAGGGGGNR